MTGPARLAIFVWATACGGAAAGPYTDLVVFGDSLSDVGNTSASTIGFQPGSGYFNGRFSNGPVYAERLAEGLGLGPLTRSETGGGNFAYGGAETDGPGGFTGLFLDSLVEQVDEYVDRVATAPPDPETLFVVFIGANDLLNGQTNVATPVGVVQTQLERLVGVGARDILGINLPRLGLTPDRLGDAAISATSAAFNQALDAAYDAVEASAAEVTIHRLDVESLFDDLVAAPTQWGFTNTTGRGRDAASGDLDGALGFVFWDGVHPTREAHALLAAEALRAVLPEGDYDRDGLVTSADYDAWLAGYGGSFDALAGVTDTLAADANSDGRVDAADYTLWRDAAGATPLAVPEPATGLMTLALLAWLAPRHDVAWPAAGRRRYF